jgi:hypothetical protein
MRLFCCKAFQEDKELDGSLIASQPSDDISCSGVDVTHLANLMISLGDVVLIDADCVNPDRFQIDDIVGASHTQEIPKVFAAGESFSIDANYLLIRLSAPDIRQAGVFGVGSGVPYLALYKTRGGKIRQYPQQAY